MSGLFQSTATSARRAAAPDVASRRHWHLCAPESSDPVGRPQRHPGAEGEGWKQNLNSFCGGQPQAQGDLTQAFGTRWFSLCAPTAEERDSGGGHRWPDGNSDSAVKTTMICRGLHSPQSAFTFMSSLASSCCHHVGRKSGCQRLPTGRMETQRQGRFTRNGWTGPPLLLETGEDPLRRGGGQKSLP